MKSFGITDKGTVRKDNQDSFIIEKCTTKNGIIVSLCDGMGGANAGKIASQLANKAFVAHIFSKLKLRTPKGKYREILQDACAEANGVAFEYSKFDEAFSGMGTTIVGGLIESAGKGYIINVGDSRAYLISCREEAMYQITRDHSYVEDLVECGAITREEARLHPRKNVITRALGVEPQVKSDYFEFTMQNGDTLILCSDGLSNMLTDSEILDFTLDNPEPETLCRLLVDAALRRGAGDNVTVIAVTR